MPSGTSKRWVTSAVALLTVVACSGGREIHGTREDPPGMPVKAAKMFDARRGWVLTEGRLVMTTNGGKTWHDLTPIDIAAPHLRAAFFLDIARGWVVGESPQGKLRIYRFTGGSWKVSDSTIDGASAAIFFADERAGWLATPEDGATGSAYVTTDGGITWSEGSIADRLKAIRAEPCCAEHGTDGLPAPRINMTFGDANNGWAIAGEPRALYATSDGGATWRKLEP